MRTIVEYSSAKKPKNDYPKRIISPVCTQACCAARMAQVGKIHEDERGFRYYWRRCQVCGFTLRHFLPVVAPERSPLIRGRPGLPQGVE